MWKDAQYGGCYAQRIQKLIYLHLFTDCFVKVSPHSTEQTVFVLMIEEKSS